jgi:hypothetical protein
MYDMVFPFLLFRLHFGAAEPGRPLFRNRRIAQADGVGAGTEGAAVAGVSSFTILGRESEAA